MAENMDLLPWTFTDVDSNHPVMIAAREYRNETPERRMEALEELMEMLCDEGVPFIPFLDVNFLTRFLRGSMFKSHTAFKRIKRYYECHHLHPDIFGTFLPSSTFKTQSLNHMTASPYRGKDNSLVIINKFGKFDSDISSFEDFLRLDALILETLLQNPVTQLCGITAILDLKNFSVTKMSDLSPTRIQTIIEIFDRSCTLRIVNGHILNAPAIANTLFNLVLPFMAESLKDTLVFHPIEDLEALHSSIPPEILPEEYGGKLSESDMVNLYDLLNDNEDYFLRQMQCGFPEGFDLQRT